MGEKLEFTRREAMIVSAGAAAAALADVAPARADATNVSGIVFEDKDGSGKPGRPIRGSPT